MSCLVNGTIFDRTLIGLMRNFKAPNEWKIFQFLKSSKKGKDKLLKNKKNDPEQALKYPKDQK